MRVFLVTVVLALVVAPSASAAKYKDCGELGDMIGAIKAKRVSCEDAIQIVARHAEGVKKPLGYKCTVRRYEGGATWTCKKNKKRVKYSRAD